MRNDIKLGLSHLHPPMAALSSHFKHSPRGIRTREDGCDNNSVKLRFSGNFGELLRRVGLQMTRLLSLHSRQRPFSVSLVHFGVWKPVISWSGARLGLESEGAVWRACAGFAYPRWEGGLSCVPSMMLKPRQHITPYPTLFTETSTSQCQKRLTLVPVLGSRDGRR